jgi:hypothetical protein
MNTMDMVFLKSFVTQPGRLQVDAEFRSKAKKALAYSIVYPKECIAVAGGKFDHDKGSPYKGMVFTPVGIYRFDTGWERPERIDKGYAMEIIKNWFNLPHKPKIVSFLELIEMLKREGPDTKLEKEMVYGVEAMSKIKL